MTLLRNPPAQVLLQDAELSAVDVASCAEYLTPFIQRYLPYFLRDEHRQHAFTLLRGKLTDLERKTTEPIAIEAGMKRRPLQLFVGAGGWKDAPVRGELCRHVHEELGDPAGVLIVDGHSVPKKGNESCGVQRQWCGRLGKVDNCRTGYFWLTPRRTARPCSMHACICPSNEPRTTSIASKPTSRRRSSSKKVGGSPGIWCAPRDGNCRTVGWSGTTNSAGPVISAPNCVCTRSVTCWTCPARRRCAT